MKYAAAYIRVSTEDQTEYSPDAQLRAIKEYCEKNDYYLDDKYIFIDEGKSGRKAEKRPAFMKMIGIAKHKPSPFQVILCHKFDRFARNREDSVVYKSLLLKECGVKVISITESIENDRMGIIMESMLEAMAEYYSINLGEEVKKGMTEKARRGEPLTIAPFGYRMENKMLVPDPEESAIVKKIFADFVAGKPYMRIAKECNEKGIKTHRGNKFENRTVEYIINNPVYAGFIRWTPTMRVRRNYNNPDTMIVKGKHEPIIDIETFEKAQERADELKLIWRKYHRAQFNPSHWLVGLLRSPCGSSMVNSNNYFVCSAYTKGKCLKRNSIRADILEKKILQIIAADMQNPVNLNVVSISELTDSSEIDNAIAALRLRLNRTKDAYERGIDSIDEYAARKAQITAEIEKLEQKKKPLINTIEAKQQIVSNMRELLSDPNNRAEIARKFIREIIWDKEAQSIDITYFTR